MWIKHKNLFSSYCSNHLTKLNFYYQVIITLSLTTNHNIICTKISRSVFRISSNHKQIKITFNLTKYSNCLIVIHIPFTYHISPFILLECNPFDIPKPKYLITLSTKTLETIPEIPLPRNPSPSTKQLITPGVTQKWPPCDITTQQYKS